MESGIHPLTCPHFPICPWETLCLAWVSERMTVLLSRMCSRSLLSVLKCSSLTSLVLFGSIQNHPFRDYFSLFHSHSSPHLSSFALVSSWHLLLQGIVSHVQLLICLHMSSPMACELQEVWSCQLRTTCPHRGPVTAPDI